MLKITLCTLALVSVVSCGKDVTNKKIYQTVRNTPGVVTGITVTDYSVNAAKVLNDTDNDLLILSTYGGTNTAGSFQGSGKGNKAIVGITGVDGILLSDLEASLDLETSEFVYFNFLVDTNADGISDKLVVADNTVGNHLAFDPTSFRVVCLPDCATWTSHTYSVTDFPTAKLVDSVVVDNGMPKWATTKPLSSALIVLGDSNNVTNRTAIIKNLVVR